MKPVIKIKRIYDEHLKNDGFRVLVDRLWPRGIKKEDAGIDEWAKEIAPSTELRNWYGHTADQWPEFQKRYRAELKKNPAMESFLEHHRDKKTITLIYAKNDLEHNHAIVLQQYLEQQYG